MHHPKIRQQLPGANIPHFYLLVAAPGPQDLIPRADQHAVDGKPMDPPKVPYNILAHDRPLLQYAVQTCNEQKFIVLRNFHTGNCKIFSKIPVTLYILIHRFNIQIFPFVKPFEDSIITKTEQE